MTDPITDRVERALADDLPPETVCADRPDLIGDVSRRLHRARGFARVLDELFPAGTHAAAHDDNAAADRPDRFPNVPGYTVESVLGRGGYGVVYKARHEGLGRSIALKMIDADGPAHRVANGPANGADLARLVREARTLANLCHRNIVSVYDVGEVDGRPYFTMECVDGGSLAAKLAGRTLPPREAATLVRTLAGAVHAAHQAGVVHRDLKPANILIAADGTPKITDFGIAKLFTAANVASAPGAATTAEDDEASAGTPAYMAPEQIRGGGGDGFAQLFDVYALGVVLYELLVGRPPFVGVSAAATQARVLHATPTPPRQLRRDVPADLNAICLKCLEKTPFTRYPSAAALAEDLGRYLDAYPTLARPLGPVRRAARFARRHPALLTTLAVALAAAGVVGVMVRQEGHATALRRAAVEDDLREAAVAQSESSWTIATAALDRAGARFGDAVPADVRGRLDEARHWLGRADRLDKIHLGRMTNGTLPLFRERAFAEYTAVFAGEGVRLGEPAGAKVDRLVASPVRDALCVAVDDWSLSAPDPRQRRWLLDLARRLDARADAWSGRIRNPAIWDDADALNRLAADVPVRTTAASTLLTLADRVRATRGDPRPLLRRTQTAHPSDFFVNTTLSEALLWNDADQAAAFARAALAARPTAAAGYEAVGSALRVQGKPYEAIDYYRHALAIDPKYARAQNSLGNALREVGRLDDAIDAFRLAQRLQPNLFWSRRDLAVALRLAGRPAEALPELRTADKLRPNQPLVVGTLVLTHLQVGDDAGARAAARRAVEAAPGPDLAALEAGLLAFLDDRTAYARCRAEMLGRYAATNNPEAARFVAVACLLMPASADELAIVERLLAVRAAPQASQATAFAKRDRLARDLLALRQGRPAPAGPPAADDPDDEDHPGAALVRALALADRPAEARSALAAAVVGYDWRRSRLHRPEVLTWHVLRREAERRLLPTPSAAAASPAVAGSPASAGADANASTDAQAAAIGACQAAGQWCQVADAYAAVLARRPTGRLRLATYRLAAGAAARAGRTDQALRWLRDGLDAVRQDERAAGVRDARAAYEVGQWPFDADLACVRDVNAVDGLTAANRQACSRLWRDVRAFAALDREPTP